MRAGSTPNYATPQYSLTGGDYKQEAPAINQMFRNVQLESQYLQGQVGTSGASGNTMTTNTDQTVSGAKTFLTGTFLYVGVSSEALTLGTTFGNSNTFVGCGSTVTIKSGGGPINAEAEYWSTANDANQRLWVLLDGAFINGETSSKAIQASFLTLSNADAMNSWSGLIGSPAAGSHSVCFGITGANAGAPTTDTNQRNHVGIWGW